MKKLKEFLEPLFLAYDESKHRRFHGKYADKPGAGNDEPRTNRPAGYEGDQSEFRPNQRSLMKLIKSFSGKQWSVLNKFYSGNKILPMEVGEAAIFVKANVLKYVEDDKYQLTGDGLEIVAWHNSQSRK